MEFLWKRREEGYEKSFFALHNKRTHNKTPVLLGHHMGVSKEGTWVRSCVTERIALLKPSLMAFFWLCAISVLSWAWWLGLISLWFMILQLITLKILFIWIVTLPQTALSSSSKHKRNKWLTLYLKLQNISVFTSKEDIKNFSNQLVITDLIFRSWPQGQIFILSGLIVNISWSYGYWVLV